MMKLQSFTIRRMACFILVVVLLLLLGGCSGLDNGMHPERLSTNIIGQWHGQVDVAKMIYKELGDELGVELSPEPEYCDLFFEFYEDNTCLIKVDTESFARAAGKCAEPYTSALLGFDTGGLVDIIMQYVAQDIPVDTGEEHGAYTVNDDDCSVLVTKESEESIVMLLDDEKHLQFKDNDIGQIVVLEKIQ